jgi:hypothetical protein
MMHFMLPIIIGHFRHHHLVPTHHPAGGIRRQRRAKEQLFRLGLVREDERVQASAKCWMPPRSPTSPRWSTSVLTLLYYITAARDSRS